MTCRRARLLSVLLFIAAPTLLAAQPQPRPSAPGMPGRPRMPDRPARDRTAPELTGTGRIKGRVLDHEGRPVRRVTVMTFGASGRSGPRVALTDESGAYELTELPAGTYQLSAVKGGYVRIMYGQRSPTGAGRPVQLADGQAVEKIDFVLSKGGVIVGRVVDEFGEAVAEASVTPVRQMTIAGRKRTTPAGRPSQTDDLGHFRLYGLPPGDYYVSAQLRNAVFGPASPPAADDTGYLPTYAPNTPSLSDADKLSVVAGQELSIDIQLVASKMLTVSGVVVSSSGVPLREGFVRLAAREMLGGMASGGPILEGGAFTIGHVAPGSYNLIVQSDSRFGPRRAGGDESSEFAVMPIVVAGENLTGLRLVTSKGMTLSGIVVPEGGPLPAQQPIRIMAAPAELEMAPGIGMRPSEVDAEGRFRLEGLHGESIIQPIGLPTGWMVKSVSYKGQDVTWKPIEVSSDGGPVRIVITNRITVLTGSVSAPNGAPLADYEVFIFPEDSARWGERAPTTRVARPDQYGVYKIEAMPPGDYYILAADRVDGEQRGNPEFLEQIKALAQRVTLADGQTQTLQLRMSALPQ